MRQKLIIKNKATNEVVKTVEYDWYLSPKEEWTDEYWYCDDYPQNQYSMTWEHYNG
jgi:hypothetical protein